jgi:proline iminopeptidase
MQSTTFNLYPEIETFNKNWLKVSDLHQIYYEECGSPGGVPVVFLHGGPGSGCNATQRRFFDPAHYRIILFDQRGCGRSTPQGETTDNHTDALVADLEKLRNHLNIAKWHVFGGSWGSTLALAYAIKHHAYIWSLTMRGIFLSRPAELQWFLGDVQHFYPEVWQRLLDFLPAPEQTDVLKAYEKRIFSDDLPTSAAAAIEWNAFESAIMRLKPAEAAANNTSQTKAAEKTADDLKKESMTEVARARVQIHYIVHQCFIDGAAILAQATTLAHIPTVIVQGRYDMVCPPQTAWALSRAMPQAEFVIVQDAGHSAMEIGVTSALVAATEKFKSIR